MKRVTFAAIAAVSAVALAGAAFAQKAQSPEEHAKDVAHDRHALFHVISAAFGPAAGMMQNKVPFDAAQAQLAGARLEILGGMIKPMSALDTSKLVPNTDAKPEVWTQRADFEAKADNLVKAAVALKTAGAAGDKDAALKAARDVGGACKSCHDKFRKEEQEDHHH